LKQNVKQLDHVEPQKGPWKTPFACPANDAKGKESVERHEPEEASILTSNLSAKETMLI
jgi:hypothetical protein